MTTDLTTSTGVAAYMSASTSEQDWQDRIDAVKAANNGDYPPFWFQTIVLGGVAEKTAPKWGNDGKLRIFTINLD